MPDEVSRRLFEALRLQIRYDFTTHIATCTITLTGDTIDAVARTSQETIADGPAEHATGNHQADGGRAALSPHGDGLCCAPSRAQPILDTWKAWLSQNNATVRAVLFLDFGAVLIGKGIAAL